MTFSSGSEPSSVAVGDFNNDTRLDIVVINSADSNVSVLLGYGNGSFQKQMTFSTGYDPKYVAVDDFNNDTRLDIVVANYYGNDVSVLIGYGNGSFQNQMKFTTGPRPWSVAFGDFNNDTRLDIAVINSEGNDVTVLLGYGNGSFQNQITFPTGSLPQSLAVGDFNNDTRLDVVVVNNGDNNVSILLQYNRGFLRDEMTSATGGGSDLRYTVAGDMNDDGQLDIVAANYGTNDVGILFGLGNGAFLNQMIFDTGVNSHPSCIALGYFNSDTQLDFAAAYDGIMTVEIFLGSRNGKFVRQISDGIRFVSTPLFIASGDINGDGISEM
ncbi:unnamed protein product [Rotaria magnacalcarata]|uniref:VCBS repeat-containing protein n=1 Tax=Rotaria magnacalcarata TaxID=392030 RepID=A0A820JL58_9BILA|nr:unnamed protein product [Rotaria magnacalcarata]CAF4328130.1 unnamed protein product [Rotaria magnacalcarata]